MALRLRNARDEVAAAREYEYVVVNDALERAVAQVASIVDAEGARRERLRDVDARVDAIVAALDARAALPDAPFGHGLTQRPGRPTMQVFTPNEIAEHATNKYLAVLVAAKYARLPQRLPAHPGPLGREEAHPARSRSWRRQHRLPGRGRRRPAEG
jgi:hypothetical protein